MSTTAGSLNGKVAIVTGASRGLGKAVALRLAAQGASLVINYRSNADEAEAVVTAIRALGVRAVAVRGDVSVRADVRHLFDVAEQELGGPVHILVANAGIIMNKPFAAYTDEDYDALMNVNARGTFYLLQEAARRIADQGRIVTLSTSLTTFFNPGFAVYQAAKAAVEQFTRSLSKEVGARGVSVVCVAPGPCDTDMLAGSSDAVRQHMQHLSAFGRLGTSDDIASLVTHVVQPEAAWLSGQVIRCNGAAV